MTGGSPPRDPDAVDAGLTRAGAISYLHIPALDPAVSAHFYESVFGWNVSGHESDRPSFDDRTGHLAGAWVTNQVVNHDPGILPYIYVPDIHAAIARIVACGGEIVTNAYPEGNLLVAQFRDPPGNVFGLWQQVG